LSSEAHSFAAEEVLKLGNFFAFFLSQKSSLCGDPLELFECKNLLDLAMKWNVSCVITSAV
jgi:hypothetical protein